VATRTFLTTQQLETAAQKLQVSVVAPTGHEVFLENSHSILDFSHWLAQCIEERLMAIPEWQAASPIAIGSWGRGELCPGSDLDVIFCGETQAIKKVVEIVEALGLKFRYRVPQDLNDWTQNVEVLEANALFYGKAFTELGAEKLKEQQFKILKKRKTFRNELLKAILKERKLRFKRYDSIANFLEPNLKFGSGGLRDLHQGLILSNWFPEKFSDFEPSFEIMKAYKLFFLMVRQKLHLINQHDILTASDQHDISKWLGYLKNRDFMSEIQKGLSIVSFYSDWISERCKLPQKNINKLLKLDWQSDLDFFNALSKDPTLQVQAVIRDNISRKSKREKAPLKDKKAFLLNTMDIKQKDDFTVAVFRSNLVSYLLPSYKQVIGLVQHDQYHRYSVDAHLLQAVREVKRIYEHPKLLGRLKTYCDLLKYSDWNILRWTAFYHDMGKGAGEAHEVAGSKILRKELKKLEFNPSLIEEVTWLVENHLILSTAAFRKNPQSPQTWEYLFSNGVRGERLYRLAVFTAIDIIATNPEAWNTWKENLLCDLVDTLTNPKQEKYFELTQKIKAHKISISQDFINQLDSEVIQNIPDAILLKDFKEITGKEELNPLVVRDRMNRVWVRFHRKEDQKGLVLDYTQRLTHVGCNIRQAFIMTDKEVGVYDWFCVKTGKTVGILKKQLLHNISSSNKFSSSFSSIQLISRENTEWVFSFRAKDKKGLLLSAIKALYESELEIIWAKVHTWGRQIEDIFGVSPKNNENPEQILKVLKEKLEEKELEIL
jgi:[protein-PII] uridylyltransferase